MNKYLKKIVGFWVGILVFSFGMYGIRNIAFQNAPCKNEMTLEELQSKSIKVKYVETGENWTEEMYTNFSKEQLEASKECSYIFKVIPTGNIYFNAGIILQEVTVEDVIRGKCEYETIWIHNGLRTTMKYNGKNIILLGMDRSFMQEDCEYLLFCDSLPTNKYSNKKVFHEAEEMWMGCYNVTRDCEETVQKKLADYNAKIEFYSNSEKIISCYNEAKDVLIQEYIKE